VVSHWNPSLTTLKTSSKKQAGAGTQSPRILLNDLRYDDVVPVSESGFGLLQNTYGGGRIGAVVNVFGGLSRIEYWGTAPMHVPNLFFTGDPTTAYQRCFRAQVVVDGDPYNLEFSNTSHFPFGYKSDFAIPERGVELRHRLTLIDDALIFSVEVLRNKHNLPLRQRFEHHGHSFHTFPERSQTDWAAGVIPSGWVMTATDVLPDARWAELQAELTPKPGAMFPPPLAQGPREGTTWIALLNESGLAMKSTQVGRHYFTGGEFRRGARASALLFASSREGLLGRAEVLRTKAFALVTKEEDEFARNLARAPQFQTGDKVLDSMLATVPPTYKSFFIENIPGTAMGASLGYYVWGWDTLNCADVHLLSGQTDFARDVLRFYRDTADPAWGVGHQYTTDFPPKVRVTMPFAAQMVYVIFLYQYGIHTGDLARWKEFFPFAKQIFQSSLKAIDGRGLGKGQALWPDYPKFCGHTGNDITVFNNSIQYQGMRCVEEMAVAVGDRTTADRAHDICRLMEKNFVPTFWDKKKGYFADSVDAKTGIQRPSYPAHALLWMTPFLSDLVDAEKLKACASFMAENHKSLRGFLSYPRWDSSFDGDGNQLGQVWPTHDMFLTRCQAIAGRQDMLESWIESSDWFWKQLTYLEGYSAQTVNDSGTPDRLGSKMNFFGTKTTYMTFFVGCAGMHFDRGGITLSEGLARPLRVRQVPFRQAVLDLSVKGKGKFARRLLVNGKPLVGSLKIPITLLKGKVSIVHERTEKAPAHPVILSLYGAEIRKVKIDRGGRLQAVVSGSTPAWLHYYSRKLAAVLFDGREIKGEYNASTREGKVLLPLSASAATIEIGK
jgi:hypothetical protein